MYELILYLHTTDLSQIVHLWKEVYNGFPKIMQLSEDDRENKLSIN